MGSPESLKPTMLDDNALISPLIQMALLGLLLACGPLLWLHLHQRGAPLQTRLRALTVLTLFLSLWLFGEVKPVLP